MDCPFCGGMVREILDQDSGGLRAFSLCCDMPQELIDNYDVFSALPEHLQKLAVERKKADYAAMVSKSLENARLFGEWIKLCDARHAHLMKEARDGSQRS